MEFLVAAPKQFRGLAKEMASASSRLATTRSVITAKVHATKSWHGTDAETFRRTWDSNHQVILRSIIASLGATAKELNVQASEQVKISDESSLGKSAPTNETTQKTPPSLTDDQLDELKRLTEEATNTNNIFKGNDVDVNALREALSTLTPAQLNEYFGTLSDARPKALGDAVSQHGEGLFNWKGTSPFERQASRHKIMSKANPEQVARIKDAIARAQPDGSSSGDAALTQVYSDDVWESVDEGDPVIVATMGEKPSGAPDGFYAGHEYFVMGKGSENNLILQNPWGPENPPLRISQEQFEKLFHNATVSK